ASPAPGSGGAVPGPAAAPAPAAVPAPAAPAPIAPAPPSARRPSSVVARGPAGRRSKNHTAAAITINSTPSPSHTAQESMESVLIGSGARPSGRPLWGAPQ